MYLAMSTNPPPPDTSDVPSVTASALFNLNYGTVSILVIWVYEYAITFDDEITFLRDSKWSIVKIIYILCRYFMFPLVIANAFHYLQQGLTLEECRTHFQFASFAAATVMICAELMFLVRAYALWHRSRAALIIIIVNFTVRMQNDEASYFDLLCLQLEVLIMPILVILALFDSAFTTIPVPGITSCNDAAPSHVIVWAYVLLVIGEAEILLSTVYQAVRNYRDGGGRNRLLAILVKHNSFYFCCTLASSVAVISTVVFLPDPYGTLSAKLQAIVHGILVTRMHRSLWNSERKKNNPSNANDVSLPTIHFRSLPQAG
ncbi:hypothetical protein BDN67DRAFT_152857 [Paxillus ammoniavirescens]|nr:hypothetical protein BDN67DRAFT_152857 [Paxillus ammoniavirescens]